MIANARARSPTSSRARSTGSSTPGPACATWRAACRSLRNRHSPFRSLPNLDWPRTIRRNIKNYNTDLQTIIPEQISFFSRQQRQNQWNIIIAMDQSGSMATSLIYGGIMGAILASMPAVETHVVAFNHEEVVDLTEHCSDPVRLQRVLDALKRVTGEAWDLRLETAPGRNGQTAPASPPPVPTAGPPPALAHPLVQRALDVLDAKLLQVDDGFGQVDAVPDDADAPVTDPEE